MAGTLFGLGMSQRVDSNGKPAVGWLLYVYAANSSTPAQTFQDTALTVPNPFPIEADANGMLPPFWVADGSYRARGTTNDGSQIYFDIPSVQSIGPSSGAAPSGGVDPTAIFQTGDLIWIDIQGTRSGWVRDNGRTIGSATSGAAERANADCQALFQYLWNNFSNTICPVGGGRGASALADWNANKQISTPDKRGGIAGGLDDMGNSAAGRFANVPFQSGNATTAGSVAGEPTHNLSAAELPPHTHTATVNDPGHHHSINMTSGSGNISNTGGTLGSSGNSGTFFEGNTADAFTGITVTVTGGGSSTSHNNVQLTVLGTFYRKL